MKLSTYLKGFVIDVIYLNYLSCELYLNIFYLAFKYIFNHLHFVFRMLFSLIQYFGFGISIHF